MDPATGAIGRLLPKLDELQKSMREEVASLRQRLATILFALSDVEKLPAYEVTEPVKRWSREARDLSYDIEHVVDKFRARQSKADDATAANRKDIVTKIKYKTHIYNASRQFATDFRGPSGKLNALIMEKPRLLSSINLDGPVIGELSDREDRVVGVGELSVRDGLVGGKLHDEDNPVFGVGELSVRDGSVVAELPDQDDPVVGELRDRGDPVIRELSVRGASESVVGELHDRGDPVVGELSVRDASVVGELPDRDDPVVGEHSVRVSSVTGELVGLHGRVEKLVNILTDDGGTSNQQLKVASILGIPGVGKTTLANQVYKRLMPRFECSAWVTVSNKPDVKNILQNMLSQITAQGDDNFGLTNIQETINKIKKALKDKRYFIVFDDMRDNKAWEIIKSALVEVRNLSAVLITSHKVSVARYACGIIYHLKSLSDISYKKLLNKRLIIGSGDNCPPQLANVPSRDLQKSSGIPSAIAHATSSDLLSGEAPEDGDTVVETNTGVHVPSSVPPRVGGIRAPDTLLQGPSVPTVSSHLKPFLMYLSMFQKGHEIDTERLVWGWIAEGLISGEEGMTSREQGESRLSELISIGFLLAIKVDAAGKARSVRLHDEEVHRLIVSLSAEENSVTIVDGKPVTPLGGASVSRLSIQGNNTLSPQVPLSRVRSLVVSGDVNPFHQETGGTNSVLSLSDIGNLSVLDLGGCASLKNDHLKGFEGLLLLKYLVLGGDCTDIPVEIGSLVYLQTLDLRASKVKELPQSIAWARKLECLLVNRHTKIPDAVGKMKALQVLGDINISRGKLLEELRNLPALRVLKIVISSWDVTCDKELFRYLGSLGNQKIQYLSIFISCSLDFLEKLDADPTPNTHLQELEIRHSTFVNLPKWITSLTKLSSLSIEVHKLSQKIIEMLGMLDTLESLFLTSKHAPDQGNFRTGFVNLKRFRFVSSALGMIHVSGGMEKLERLYLSFQASLTKDFNFGLGNLSSLKHIHVEIICFNASSRVVQDIERAINKAIPSSGVELVIAEVRKEDMEKNEDGQETQGCSPVQYFDLIKNFNSHQRQAIEEVGFGDLLKMKGLKIRHESCKRLAEAYDVQSEAFNIRGSMIKISIEDVGRLMCIPSKGKAIVEVPKMKNLDLLSFYKDKNGTISLDTLQDDLSSNNNCDEHFIRRVLLYTIGMLLCPTTQRIVSSDYLNLLENVEEIKTVNWASLTLNHLKDSLKRYKTGQENIEGNLVLLQLCFWEKLYISKPENINYTEVEDVALVRAWECVSLDAVTGNDQTGKKYWQRIEDKFHWFMPVPSTCSSRSLQYRFDVIKQCCSRWSGCLDQVRSALPSGCTIDDYDRIALERYKQIPASERKPFMLQHCWKILEHSEKWRLRDQESPSKKESFVTLDDEELSDKPKGRKEGKPDKRKGDKEKETRKTETASLSEKIDEMMKSRETLVAQQLQEKLEMAEKKQEDKVARWQEIREDEKRKAAFGERRILLEENKVMADIIAEENRVMMLDPNGMDAIAREWWDIRRMEILQRRRQASGSGGV